MLAMAVQPDTLLPALVILAVAVGILWLVLRGVTRAVGRAAARLRAEGLADEAELWARRITSLARHSFQVLVVLVAAAIMVQVVGVPGISKITWAAVLDWLAGPGLRILLVIGSAYVLIRAVRFLIENLQLVVLSRSAPARQEDLSERKKRIATMGNMLSMVATVLIAGVAIVTVLALVHIDIRPILTGAGIAGLAVGFGAQNLVRDVIAGFFLILEDQVRVGDVVDVNGRSGLVEDIRLRTITLRGVDGTVHIIPNGAITQMSNMTKDFSYAVVEVGIGYKESVDEAMKVIEEVGADLGRDPELAPKILGPLETLGVDSFRDSAVVIRTRIKTAPIEQWIVASEMRRRLKSAFDARGTEVPFVR